MRRAAGEGRETVVPVRTALFDQPLAIVDVETTGQSSMYGKVIEVAVLRVEGGGSSGSSNPS